MKTNKFLKYFKATLFIPLLFATISEAKEYKFVDSLSNEPLIKDSKLDLFLRNRFKYLNENEVGPTYIHTAWAQTIGLNYQSGLWKETLGFDVSYTSVTKLGASNFFASRDLLWNDGPGFKSSNAKGFTKFNNRFIKLHLGDDEGLSYKAKYGWQAAHMYTVLKSPYESAQNSYLGYTGTLKYNDFSIDTLYFDSVIERFSPNKEKFRNRNNEAIEYIAAGGINYNTKELKATYNYGYAKDFIDRHFIDLNYMPYSNITLGFRAVGNVPLEMYKNMPSSRQAANGSSWVYEGTVKWQYDDLGMKVGVGYTDAAKNDGSLGYFDRHPVKNARWRLDPMSSAAYHYQRDGELALTGLIDYKYAEDFYSAVQLNYGQFDFKNNKIKTGELNLINAWQPSDPRLKNFTIFTKLTKAWLYQAEENRIQPVFDDNGHYIRRNAIAADIIFDYKFNIF
ncbi:MULTISPECIES: OprD family porin [Providencia]|uniref:OprD family porin n=1 Tax=Providencia TaxID=586 RepID=UPI0010BF0172|nr:MULTISPECIES: OprD family porin [Providencia]QIF65558.1 OprD family porin [Providencia sp. 1709051003]